MSDTDHHVMPNSGESGERFGRLETSVKGLWGELDQIRGTLKDIQQSLAATKETNWGVIIAGLAVAGSFWAAAIKPLNESLERHEKMADTLAAAVLKQNDKSDSVKESVNAIDRRIFLLEYKQEHK